MALPYHIDDGNFKRPDQNGPWQYSHPFTDRGDAKSFEAKRSMRVAETSYRRPTAMAKINTELGACYLVDYTEASNVENGLLEWQETYASVPQKRVEPSGTIYTFQTLLQGFEVLELSAPVYAENVFEYSLNKAALPVIVAPRLVSQSSSSGTFVWGFGGWHVFAVGERVLAQDAFPEIYKGLIYMRRSIYIIVPSYKKLV